jgi:AcrR family transcriptional regulator
MNIVQIRRKHAINFSKSVGNYFENCKVPSIGQGIETLNMRAIAKDAEISVGTLHNFFPNKDYIVIALMTSFWENFLEDVETFEVEGETLLSNLRKMYEKLANTMKAFRIEWLSGEGFQSQEAKGEGAKHQEQMRNCVLFAIERQFEQFHESSDVFTENELARLVLSNWVGTLTNSYMDYKLFERVLISTIEK